MTTKKAIVVCDDEPSVLEIAELVLGEDFQIIPLNDNKLLVPTVKKLLPALVVTDVLMPSLPLAEVIAALRQTNQINLTPILIMSASLNLESIAKEVVADALLAKPFDIADLRQIVYQLVA